MVVGAQPPEPAENWDDDFDFQADGGEPGTGTATPFSSLMHTTTTSGPHASTESRAHLDPFLSSSAFPSIHAFATKRKLSAPAEEEDWDAELDTVGAAVSPGSKPPSSTIQHVIVKPEDGEIENWDDDFEDASSPRKSTTGRPSANGGDSTHMIGSTDLGEEYETWDEEERDIGRKSVSSQIQLPVSQVQPLRKHPIVPTQVSSLQQRVDLSKNDNDEFGLLSHDSTDDDEDHTVTARQRRLRSTSRSGSPPPPLPQLSHVNQALLPFPPPTLHPSSPSNLQSPALSPAITSVTSPSIPSPLPIYARSPSAMSGSSAGSSANIHGQALYGGGSHIYQSTTRPSGLGYTSASVFSLPNTLHSHTSHGSTVPLNPANSMRPSTSSVTPTSNRLRKQHGGGSSAGFAQLPPSPLIHKERERRRLRKKSRPSVGNRGDVFVVDEDVAGREDGVSDHEQIITYQHPERPQDADVDAQKADIDVDNQLQPPSKLTDLEKHASGQSQREEPVIRKLALPQTPRASRTTRSVSAGPEHGTARDTTGHGSGGLLGRIGSVKRWAKAKRRRGSTTPQEVEVSETDRVADGDISVSDFSEPPRQQPTAGPLQHSLSEQVQRTPRPRSSMSSFLNTSRGGSPSPSPGSPSKWPNFFRNNDMSSPTAQKSRRRMTMGPLSGTPTPTRTRTNTITRESLDNDPGRVKSTVPRRSTSQSRSRAAQVYGSALGAARASNGSLALNSSRTSLTSVKEHDSPAPRTRRKSFGRLIMDRLPSAIKTPEKVIEPPTGHDRPVASVRRISLVNKHAKSSVTPSDEAPDGDNNASTNTGPQTSAATPTGKRTRSRSRRYDLDDAPPVPELSAPYYGILRSADPNASQQSLSLYRQQSRASSSGSHLPMAPSSESRKINTRAVSTQSVASAPPIDAPSRPSLSGLINPDFGARLRQLGDSSQSPVRSEATMTSQGRTSNSVEDSGDAPSKAMPLSLLPPIELHPPSPPQTLGASTITALKPDISATNVPSFSNLNASKSSQGSDVHSATTSRSSLFFTPTSSPNAKKRSTGVSGLSASPHSPGKASSLGRTTGPLVGSDSVGFSGTGTIGKTTTLRRNSLGDLKIPTRISQAQVSIRRDLGLVKEFAGRIGELKEMKVTYLSLLDLLQTKMPSSNSSTTHNPTTASSLMDLFNGSLDTKSELERSLQDRVTSIKTRYDISWECAELLIELGGGPVTEISETAMASVSTTQSQAETSASSDHSTTMSDTPQSQLSSHPQFPSASYPSLELQISPPFIALPQSLTSSTLPSIAPKRNRERAITLASSNSTSDSVLGPPQGGPAPFHEQYQKTSGSMKGLPNSPSDAPASTGRRDLSQRQLLLLREMLGTDADTKVELTSTDASSTRPVAGSAQSGSESIVADVNVDAQRSSINDRETFALSVGWRWGAGSTVELPPQGQEREAYLGHSRQAAKATGHRRQWSRVGLGKPSRGNVPETAEVGDDDDEHQKRWKGMRAIRDMLRAMKRGHTEVPQRVSQYPPLPPLALSSSQPMASSQLSPPLPSNRPGGSSSRFGALGVRMGMHSTSSLSSAVSMSSHGSKGHTLVHSNPRVTSTGAILSTNSIGTGKELDATTQGGLSNQGTVVPQQYQPKATKSGPRRPSLASLFRIGYQSSSKPQSVNPRSVLDTRTGNSTGLNSSLEQQIQEDAWASRGKEDEGQEVEDDWDRMDSASDIETRSTMGRHNATVRGKPDQRRKLLKGHALKGAYRPQAHAIELDATLSNNTGKQSDETPLSPSFIEGSTFSPPTTANENAGSRSSLSLSSSHGHSYKPPPTDFRTNLTKVIADSRTIRPNNALEKTESRLPGSQFVPHGQESTETEEVLEGFTRQSSAKTNLLALSSPQYPRNSSSHFRPPLSPLSVPPSVTTPDIGIASSDTMSISASAGSGIALAMTPDNIKPLLENAKEVQERLSECIRELTELLQL